MRSPRQQSLPADPVGFWERAGAAFVAALTVLLPLKFGTLTAIPEAAGYFPEEPFAYLLVSWPGSAFGIASAAALLLCLPLLRHCPLRQLFRHPAVGWLIVPALAAGWGCWRSAHFFYAEAMFRHYLGITWWSWSVFILVSRREKWRNLLWNAFGVGVLLLTLVSWYQWFWGLDDTLSYVLAYERESLQLSEAILAKLADRRLYGPMASANLLAGFLLTALPVFLVIMGEWSRFFEPRKWSLGIFLGLGAVLAGGCLLLTKTRGAFAVLLLVAAAAIFSYPQVKKSVKLGLLALIVMTTLGGAWYIQQAGRGFSSAGERWSYLKTSFAMVCEHPFAGQGWGSFFYRHMRMKTTAVDEAARDPHNIAVSFMVSSGIPAALAVVLMFWYPLAQLYRQRTSLTWRQSAILWGVAAGFGHMLTEITMLTPAIPAAQALLLMLAFPGADALPATSVDGKTRSQKILGGLLAAALGAAALGSLYADWRDLQGEKALSRLQDYALPASAADLFLIDDGKLQKLFEQVETYRPGQPFASAILARSYAGRGRFELAVRHLEEAIKRDPGRAGYYWQLAQLLELRREFDRAAECRQKARELFPSNPQYQVESARR